MAEVAPESNQDSYRFLGFDGQGGLQLIGGLVIGLIALYSSYDHVNFFRSTIHLNQQWGVWLIVTSLAVVAIDAQLASRSRLGEENRRCEEALARSREANDAAEERNRAAEARERQAEATKRQGQGIALLRSSALLSARVQLDPSELNRSRLNAFLALLAEQALLDQLGPE
jgi:predicted lipid-binding transport protein (Tim44 family)